MSEGEPVASVKNPWLTGVLSVAVVAALAGVVFAWLLTPLGPDAEAAEALHSTDTVEFHEAEYGYEFAPVDEEPMVGLIIYPAGRVDHRSYSLLARDIAERGYLVAVVEMPLSMPMLDPSRADEVIEAHPEVVLWTVGGHAQGGAMAARYVSEDPEHVSGLALMAAYPRSGDDLSSSEVTVTSIFGTLDGIVDAEKFMEARNLLPPSTTYVSIAGGNHAQFGSYGTQPGDGQAIIPPDEQRWQTVNAIHRILLPLRRRSGAVRLQREKGA